MFPNNFNMSTIRIRDKEKYDINQAKIEWCRISAIPFLQRNLNESAKDKRKQLKALLQVNCVSHVDPITFWKIKLLLFNPVLQVGTGCPRKNEILTLEAYNLGLEAPIWTCRGSIRFLGFHLSTKSPWFCSFNSEIFTFEDS